MPFTNVDSVRKHLVDSVVAQASFRDVPLRLEGTSAVALLHRNLIADSIVVKGKEISSPQFVHQALDTEPTFIGKEQLIPDSVAVASDTSLGIIYTENVDYQVDYSTGNISRLEDGSIPDGEKIAIWFYAYTIFQQGADYFADADAGTLRRSANSHIEDGQVVFVDYRTVPASFSDGQIENAIIEANDRLGRLIAPEHQHSSEQSLISAETYLALAVLFRTRASASLQGNTSSQSAAIAREWLEVAESYEAQALSLVSNFASPRSTLAGPSAVNSRSRK